MGQLARNIFIKYQTRGRKKPTSDLKTKNENNNPTEHFLRNKGTVLQMNKRTKMYHDSR